MLFKSINRTDPERVFVVVEASEALAADDCVQWDMTTDVDGVKVEQPDTGELYGFVGVVDAAVASGDFGLVQVYGYRSTSKVVFTDTSHAAGAPLAPVAGQDYFATVASTAASNTTVTLQPIYAVMLESTVSSGSGNASPQIFIRAM